LISFEHSVTIDRPAETVFAYLTDVRNLRRWQQGVVEIRPGGDMGPGATFTEVRSFLGKRIESTIEVTEYEAPRLFSIKVVSGPIPFSVRHTLEPSGDATLLQVEGTGEPGGFFKLAEGLVARQAERAAKKDFARLKKTLEAEG
jgi:carbon monoxide dehydrogenase subunit G